ncbi:3-oxoacyl-[acyl-carrier-protein] reductase FabG [Cercospora beticola]|uniref:3-oxoacyl-[acyl-carrier-protein] reductase FabG n=1 Tax=Cercospora beticola TaxID=122368 RepID=A0A2G5I2E1_CERBT|nr:3-oxoacyl-[acyl-carrier-protein] reductase FabG [Cercospora beticola]PIA98682.1 3-oxoacyl-[acyl-carrier-protein] reductase FabG [Cercospora beticola]WPB00686.1 hypothetical protein RHO25_005306 [Cercospora beticola]CAK1361077.1 unnamed protein product [Cercospora beticola]
MEECVNYPDLHNKVALVMGIGQTASDNPSAWDNGAAVALRLSQNHAIVFGCDLDLTAAEYTKSGLPGPCTVMAADVTSASDVSKVVDACMSMYGHIDILVNNVGRASSGEAVSMSEEGWESQLRIHLGNIYLACHKVMPIMRAQDHGSIINCALNAGVEYRGKPQNGYSAAKAAVVHFTRAMAAIFAKDGVRLNCVVPGSISMPLVKEGTHSRGDAIGDIFGKRMQHNLFFDQLGSPFDVADAVAFLASAAAKCITGHSLVIDDGLAVPTGT